jgi:ABC-2 type transport system ATP-binding protein
LPEKLSARRYLTHLMRLRCRDDMGAAAALAERLGLELDRRIGELSKGNRQKVGVVAALMHDPELLILDEPTSGLDPLRQRDIQVILRERADAGRTVFLSSHALDQVEHVAGRVGIVNEARLVAVEEIAALKRRARRRLEVHFSEPFSPNGFADVAGVRDLHSSGGVWRFEVEGPMGPVISALGAYPVETLTSEEPELDEIFLDYYGASDVG